MVGLHRGDQPAASRPGRARSPAEERGPAPPLAGGLFRRHAACASRAHLPVPPCFDRARPKRLRYGVRWECPRLRPRRIFQWRPLDLLIGRPQPECRPVRPARERPAPSGGIRRSEGPPSRGRRAPGPLFILSEPGPENEMPFEAGFMPALYSAGTMFGPAASLAASSCGQWVGSAAAFSSSPMSVGPAPAGSAGPGGHGAGKPGACHANRDRCYTRKSKGIARKGVQEIAALTAARALRTEAEGRAATTRFACAGKSLSGRADIEKGDEEVGSPSGRKSGSGRRECRRTTPNEIPTRFRRGKERGGSRLTHDG